MDYKYISADNHTDSFWLPKRLFQDRLPQKFRDDAPYVAETDSGSHWHWEGKKRGDSADGSKNEGFLKRFYPKADIMPGALPPFDPHQLLAHMDLAKVYAGVFYADTRKWKIDNLALRLACTQVYNDFVMELNATSPERLFILPQIPTYSAADAGAEFERLLKKGVKAVEFGVFDLEKPIYSEAWDPVYAMAAEAKVPLCTHIGDGAGVPYPPNERGSGFAHFSIAPFSIAKFIPQFIFAGCFERFPGLQISAAECRIGWLPFLISWMDRQVEVRPPDPTVKLSRLPSEYVMDFMSFTFEDDKLGAKMIQYDWSYLKKCAIWGSDYPHEQGTWPDATVVLDRMLEGLTEEEKRYIVCDHAAKIFNVKIPKPAALA